MKLRFYFSILWLGVIVRTLGGDSVVVFNEIMYHPRDGDPVEWVELYNQMAVDVDISGWEIDGIGYTFPTNTVIAGKSYIAVANNPATLAIRAGLATVYGPFSGRLANEGEQILLRNHNQRIMDVVDYGTSYPWPAGPDSSGFTLAKRNPNAGSESPENWTHSHESGGTPGGINFLQSPSASGIVLNEVAASTNGTFWAELVNAGTNAVDSAIYELEFSRAPDLQIQLTNSPSLEPGAYFDFELSTYHPRANEKLFFYSVGRKRLLDAVEIEDRIIGRSTAHEDRWLFPSVETPGAANEFPFAPTIVINEIMYANLPSQTNETWLELFNAGTNTVDLSGWRIAGLGYSFPSNTTIVASGYLVIAQDAQALSAKYPDIRILGNFTGRLSRSSDHLVLEDPLGNPVDEVRYYDRSPWPDFADGRGASLELRDSRADNSRAEAWGASHSAGEWQSYTYTAVAASDNGPTRWNEFIFGLLDAGEVLLDDFSVTENPSSTAREILQNGSFENGGATWRFLGTHRNATVIVDPENPANHVLRLAADGPTEHMHNHVETTLVGNQPIRNGTSYRISYRAKWLAGCNKLNTRLYFNRVARTMALQQPDSLGTPGRPNSIAEINIGPTFAALKHTPIVPKATEAVQVTVRASDPDGVQRCVLHWGVNGTNWVTMDMQQQGDDFAAAIPPQPAGTVVQFYVEGEDDAGAASFYPAAGPGSRALYKVQDNQTLSSRLHNIRLIMLPAEASALHASTNVMSNGRSPATVVYNESEVFYECGLHLQASERGRMEASRVGFTVSFPSDHLFRGVHDTITFDRSGGWSGKGGRQDEIIMRHIINQAGDSPDMYNDLVRVLTPLTTHTGPAILLMAKYNDEFIDGSVHPKDGSLFKIELVYYPTTSVGNDPQQPKIPQPDEVVGVDIGNLGNSPENYRWFLTAENHAGDDDYAGLIRLAQAFSLTGAALEQKTSELMDMEQWTRVFAFKSLSGDVDTYGFGLPHNHLFYIPPQGKALTFPWDMDFSWTRPATDTITVGNRVGQIIHAFPAYQRLYLGHLHDIIGSAFNTNYMARWTTHYGALVGQNYSAILSYIGQRATSVRSQLRTPSTFQITSFAGDTFTTNATSMVLRGTAPYTMKRLQKNFDEPGTGFIWSATETWEMPITLKFGTNRFSITGYDFHNQAAAILNVTIISSAGLPDADDDGMPDEWEIGYNLDPLVSNAAEDPDNDGFSNLSEYLAGTSPADGGSRLALTLQKTVTQQLQLTFNAQAGRAYRLQYRLTLAANWKDLITIPAAATNRVITQPQTISIVASSLFYRVIVDTGAQ
ncbi:MAG TPA: lamin tail domain-containing protein [Candidatus Kapabacteria bacterium]|nr:lamin tail domain-containing protein [Candidatus Kapabacteria bacterium]